MNILIFLTPKQDVAYVFDDFTIRQALEKMEYHQYSSIPILNRKGKYIGTLTEGDLLWTIKNLFGFDLNKAESMKISDIKRKNDFKSVGAQIEMDELINTAMNQNFVPVEDDQGIFIGIVTRKKILQYGLKKPSTK